MVGPEEVDHVLNLRLLPVDLSLDHLEITMVFSSDIRQPIKFEINRCYVSEMVEGMMSDDEFPETERLREQRVERISVKMEDVIYNCLVFSKPFELTDVFLEMYEAPLPHA